MLENIAPRVECLVDWQAPEGITHTIILHNCNFTIGVGGRLEIDNNPVFKPEQESALRESGLLIDENKLRVESRKDLELIFESCILTVQAGVSFSCAKVTFNHCSILKNNDSNEASLDFSQCKKVCLEYTKIVEVKTTLNNRQSNIETTNTENGKFCFSEGLITTAGVDFIERNITIKCGKGNTFQCRIPGSYSISDMSGKCDGISLSSTSALLEFTDTCNVGKITIGANIFLDFIGVSAIAKSRIEASNSNDPSLIKIALLSKLEQLNINNLVNINLDVSNTDLSNTDVCFNGNSTLNFEIFKSVASVWNPSRICYQGFSPKMNPEEVKKKNIRVLPAREFFCEMKTKFSKRGDSITASEFYAAEMKAYRAYSENDTGAHWWDKLILRVSFYSSDFGQNWFQSLFWYLILSMAFVDVFWFTFLYEGYCLDSIECVKFFANFLSPLTLEFDKATLDLKISSWFILLWIAWKIIAGFLIYQIIISTRRFVRKW